MHFFNVSYDLNSPGQNYEGLINEIKRSSGYIKVLKSGWVIATPETPAQLSERLRRHIDGTDRLLITRIRGMEDVSGWLGKEAWEWMHRDIPVNASV